MAVTTFASPPWWRIAVALIVVPLVASFAYAVYSPAYQGLPDMMERVVQTTAVVAFFGAYPPTVVLGIPLILYFRGRVRASLANCAMAGASVATFPWLCLTVFFGPDKAYTNDHITHENGMMTWWGLLETTELLAEIAVFGIAAGGLFWLVAAAGIKRQFAAENVFE
ncbi:hypothetical protein HFN76_19385 [Rhizobium laguerreae]|uniref:hypothetical protein n=1 Tax=Rhizobium laguerreae TaxID=1076926 RepID=UPI001C904746|nr:hypothetical protein [Rhizobium laguerreae]MBY3514374.1 hypothetical protein [Rhizobium laguerreae]